MYVDLDKQDLISLAKGTVPNYSVMDNPLIEKHGNYSGSHDTWEWNYTAFDKCSEEEIWSVYQLCKNSWEKGE